MAGMTPALLLAILFVALSSDAFAAKTRTAPNRAGIPTVVRSSVASTHVDARHGSSLSETLARIRVETDELSPAATVRLDLSPATLSKSGDAVTIRWSGFEGW